MNTAAYIARHFQSVFFGGNWTAVNLKETLAGITWQHATTKMDSFNSIAALVFHIDYYVRAITAVLHGRPLDAHDKYSFEVPPIATEEAWEQLVREAFSNAETLAGLIEKLPEEKLDEIFVDAKYGTYYRNLHGVIEHTHYHLGQIVLLKKMLLQKT